MVRRMLFWACLDYLQRRHHQEAAIYADLLAQEEVCVDEWSGIEFGNIDESNEEPLTNELLAELNSKFARMNA